MDFIWESITEWLKEVLIGGIVSNLSGVFDSTNEQVGNIVGQVGMTPQAWNGGIFTMIQNLSNNVILPIAGAILAIVAGEYDLTALPKGEQEILKLISRQVLIAVSGVYRYQESSITILCGGAEFTANLKMPLDIGWKQYSHQEVTQKWCDGLTAGMTLNPNNISVKKGTTKPPRHFTEDLLLASMETAGAKEMSDEAERKGLGTPATRASILEKLVATGMVAMSLFLISIMTDNQLTVSTSQEKSGLSGKMPS